MFSSVRPAYRCLRTGSLGGRDKITSLGYHSTLQPFGLLESEHERCHIPYSIRQIKSIKFVEEFPRFKA
jgi:hypothetical protein